MLFLPPNNNGSRIPRTKLILVTFIFCRQINNGSRNPGTNLMLATFIFCFQDLVELAGPEEMKWPMKELYTYNVQNGDKFILDEKVSLGRLHTTSRSSMTSALGSASPRAAASTISGPESTSKHQITFQLLPKPGMLGGKPPPPAGAHNANANRSSSTTSTSRNPFGKNPTLTKNHSRGNWDCLQSMSPLPKAKLASSSKRKIRFQLDISTNWTTCQCKPIIVSNFDFVKPLRQEFDFE